jgi:hypothetical protein
MPRQVRNCHEVSTIKCAAPGCRNTPSGATDRWFVTLIERDVFYCRRYSASRPLRRFEQPACGQACAVRLFDRFLSRALPKEISGTANAKPAPADVSLTCRKPTFSDVASPAP